MALFVKQMYFGNFEKTLIVNRPKQLGLLGLVFSVVASVVFRFCFSGTHVT